MRLTLIVAMDEDGAIGDHSGGLPWHLPDESAHFRAYCTGQWLLVGRRTLEEMHGWFQPAHRVVVLTRHPLAPLPTPGGPGEMMAAATVPDAVRLAREAGTAELVVIGGAHTYAKSLPWANRLVVSRLALRSGGSVHFPTVAWHHWRLAHTETNRRDTTTGIAFEIEYWVRRPTLTVGPVANG